MDRVGQVDNININMYSGSIKGVDQSVYCRVAPFINVAKGL
jgi:hypothetical protein